MRVNLLRFCGVGVLMVGVAGLGQVVAGPAAGADAGLAAAQRLVGKALFLRGFYVSDELSYDSAGKVIGSPKMDEWTVAAVDVMKVSRKGPKEIELEGLRAAVRYNVDQHLFERHVQKDEKVKILVTDAGVGVPGDAKGLEAAFGAMFAVGIDPGLQRAMPEFWRHYFDPAVEWPADGLSGVTVYPSLGLTNQPRDLTAPQVQHKVEAKLTSFAERDRLQGNMLLRIVVDAEGVPRRIYVVRPLGYGMEERGVEAVAKWRFTPAMKDGKAVAAGVVVQLDFAFVAQRR